MAIVQLNQERSPDLSRAPGVGRPCSEGEAEAIPATTASRGPVPTITIETDVTAEGSSCGKTNSNGEVWKNKIVNELRKSYAVPSKWEALAVKLAGWADTNIASDEIDSLYGDLVDGLIKDRWSMLKLQKLED